MKKAIKEMFMHEIAKAFKEGCTVGDKNRNHHIDNDIKVSSITILQDYTHEIFCINYYCNYDNFEKTYLLDYETAYIKTY